MGRFHKTSHGPRKMHIVGYSIVVIPKKYDPRLDSHGLPKGVGFEDFYKTKKEAQNAVFFLKATQLYKSLEITEVKV